MTTQTTETREDAGVAKGRVISIHISPAAEQPMLAVSEVRAVPGRGLEGDRYYEHTGTYSETPGTGRDVTLVATEAIEQIARDNGVNLGPGETRRNILTAGVDLNALVDVEFRVGQIALLGMRLCEPCDYLERIVGQAGTTKALVHRGGLRCDIIRGGTIHVGDEIVTP
ncbi:MAG: MOSC domain-containing protein [Chloroflexota bacterium]